MTPRLFVHVLSLQARKLMSYRVDFWLTAVAAFTVELLVAWFLWRAVFRATASATVGGYSLEAMVAYYVAVLLVGKLVRGQERDLNISKDIYEGTLTRYLIYPSSWVGFKYAEHLGSILPSTVQVLVLAGAVALFLPVPLGLDITVVSVLMALPAVILGNLLWFLLRLPIQMVAFWADNVWSLNVLLRYVGEILGGLMLPLAVFPDGLQAVLHYLPFRFLFSFPTLVLLGQVDVHQWLAGLAVVAAWCGVLALVSRAVWLRGQLSYTGVGI